VGWGGWRQVREKVLEKTIALVCFSSLFALVSSSSLFALVCSSCLFD
jgi:hypothetical protein